MDKEYIFEQLREYLKNKFLGESSGHDWWHMVRVYNNAMNIATGEKCDMFIVQLAALLHDVADYKFNDGDEKKGSMVVKELLENFSLDKDIIEKVCYIIDNISFQGAGVKTSIDTIEGMIVQDADRLDAMGAIGISRTFAYGGYAKREIHNPEIKPEYHTSFEQYKRNNSTTINHFYEKLLLLKDLMNTTTGRRIAEERHKFMEQYLEQFFLEWDGEK